MQAINQQLRDITRELYGDKQSANAAKVMHTLQEDLGNLTEEQYVFMHMSAIALVAFIDNPENIPPESKHAELLALLKQRVH